jgi:hypothetical protein
MFEMPLQEEERASEKGQCPAAERYDDEDSDSSDFIVSDDGLPIADRRKKRKPMFKDV